MVLIVQAMHSFVIFLHIILVHIMDIIGMVFGQCAEFLRKVDIFLLPHEQANCTREMRGNLTSGINFEDEIWKLGSDFSCFWYGIKKASAKANVYTPRYLYGINVTSKFWTLSTQLCIQVQSAFKNHTNIVERPNNHHRKF